MCNKRSETETLTWNICQDADQGDRVDGWYRARLRQQGRLRLMHTKNLPRKHKMIWAEAQDVIVYLRNTLNSRLCIFIIFLIQLNLIVIFYVQFIL